MNIDVAIVVLRAVEDWFAIEGYTEHREAVKLGIEALKRVKAYKEAHIGLHYEPMPGETVDK